MDQCSPYGAKRNAGRDTSLISHFASYDRRRCFLLGIYGDQIVTVNQLRTYFWQIDPGYFNLKQATKTILAVLLTLWWMRDEELLTQVIAGIASGTSLQGVVAKSLAMRLAHIVIFDAIYFTALALGFAARDFPHWTAILLIVWGFLANYIRRFGLENSKAPMMAWVLCFLATVVPYTGSAEVHELIYGVVVGFLVSALVIICIFPENYPRLFINNSNRFFKNLAQGLEEMRRHVITPKAGTVFASLPFVARKATLEKLLSSNQAIQQSSVFANQQKRVGHILIQQYALLNAYALMVEVYHSLWTHKRQLPHEAILALDYMSDEFTRLFSTMRVRADYLVDTECPNIILPNLAEKLGRVPPSEPAIVMALLNFKLSFDLLNQHEAKLLRGVDEA